MNTGNEEKNGANAPLYALILAAYTLEIASHLYTDQDDCYMLLSQGFISKLIGRLALHVLFVYGSVHCFVVSKEHNSPNIIAITRLLTEATVMMQPSRKNPVFNNFNKLRVG